MAECCIVCSGGISVAAGHEEIVRWLVNNDLTGTIAFIQDNNGDTPAHDAADNGYVFNMCMDGWMGGNLVNFVI